METIYTFVPSRNHEYPDHPERPGRLGMVEPLLDSFGAERVDAVRASVDEVARVHELGLSRCACWSTWIP